MGHRPPGGPVCGRRFREPERADRSAEPGRRDLTRRCVPLLFSLFCAATPAVAQDFSIWLDATGSHAQPPADVTADPSQYGFLGGRLDAAFDWGSASVSGRYGEALAGSQGRWLQGDATLATGGRAGPVGLRAVATAFGLRYLDPFAYDAAGFEIRPAASVSAGRFVVSAQPRLTVGQWSTDALEGDLRVAGADLGVERSFGSLFASASAGAAHVENGVTAGTFAGARGRVVLDRGRWTAGADVQLQRSPLETELGGGVHASLTAAPGVELTAYVGRQVRDELFGTAGTVTASLTAAVRAGSWSPPEPPSVVAIGEPGEGGRVVTFAIRAPEAETVSLSGDFTGWDPVGMERSGDGWWRTRQTLGPGLYHFGFLVDGQWAIPPEAPGVVEDGWGRENASIVVEP